MKVWERLAEELDGLVFAQRLYDTERELEYTSLRPAAIRSGKRGQTTTASA